MRAAPVTYLVEVSLAIVSDCHPLSRGAPTMRFTIERELKAAPPDVWKLIGDFSLSPGNGVSVRVVDAGAEDGTRLVRDITVGKMAIRERIDEVVPGASFSYSITKGTPTRWYKGKGQIAAAGDGTAVSWSGEFAPLIPFTGPVIGMIAKRTVTRYLDAVLSKLDDQ
ncbi:MAG: hypothetical protein GF331_14550 [Chitinivibrionales bacterium]|nr:hypothetical protein [Chitinivibrionales bacterium]